VTVFNISLTDPMGNISDLHYGGFWFDPRLVHQRLKCFSPFLNSAN